MDQPVGEPGQTGHALTLRRAVTKVADHRGMKKMNWVQLQF
jgi:hypothetical protein